MTPIRFFRLAMLATACAVGGALAAAPTGLAALSTARVADPLERPAQTSVHALDAMLGAVTRAGDRLVAVGERGTVLLSDDNGGTWRQARHVPVSVLLTAVRFGTARDGWAVGHGGVVLHTGDAGESWTRQLDGVAVAALMQAAARRAAGSGGDTATAAKLVADAQQLVRDGADKPFLDVLADGASGAIAVGAFGLAVRTMDAGKTWQPWQAGVLCAKGNHLYGIARSGATIFVAGEQGALFRSDDNGTTLAPLSGPYKGSYFGVLALSPARVVVYGLRGSVFSSADAGTSWRAAAPGGPASLTAGTLLADGTLLLASQAGALLSSADQGLSFAPVRQAGTAPATGLAQARDGGVVVAGLRGPARVGPVVSGGAASRAAGEP